MQEKSEPEAPPFGESHSVDEDNQSPFSPAAIRRRVWRNLFVVVTIGTGAAALFGSRTFFFGVALGGALALLNFRWLEGSLRGILELRTEKAPPGTTMKIILRWFFVGVLGYIAWSTGYFDGAGILAGLLAPAAAAMIEAGYLTFRSFAHREDQ